jgi:hypothetical protein
MAVSRILFSSATSGLGSGGHLSCPGNFCPGSFLSCDYYPKVGLALRDRAGDPCLLFCLAPHRVCHAPLLSRRAVGSYPAFSPLLLDRRFEAMARLERATRKRSIFCDTFRRKELSFTAPLLSQGVLPCGVRTFLSSVLLGAEATARQPEKDTCVF